MRLTLCTLRPCLVRHTALRHGQNDHQEIFWTLPLREDLTGTVREMNIFSLASGDPSLSESCQNPVAGPRCKLRYCPAMPSTRHLVMNMFMERSSDLSVTATQYPCPARVLHLQWRLQRRPVCQRLRSQNPHLSRQDLYPYLGTSAGLIVKPISKIRNAQS